MKRISKDPTLFKHRITVLKSRTNGQDLAKQYVSIMGQESYQDGLIIHKYVLSKDFRLYRGFELVRTFQGTFDKEPWGLFLQRISIKIDTLKVINEALFEYYGASFLRDNDIIV